MNKKKEYILIAGITLLSWGVFYPRYTFTTDACRPLSVMQEDESGSGYMYGMEEDVQAAIQGGRVLYRLKIAEYIKNLFTESIY